MKKTYLSLIIASLLTIGVFAFTFASTPSQTPPGGNPVFPPGNKGPKGVQGDAGDKGPTSTQAGPAGAARGFLPADSPLCVLCAGAIYNCGGNFPTYGGGMYVKTPIAYNSTCTGAPNWASAGPIPGPAYDPRSAPVTICCKASS